MCCPPVERFGVGLKIITVKSEVAMKYYTVLRTWTDSLDSSGLLKALVNTVINLGAP
jgi:hypothetical protein